MQPMLQGPREIKKQVHELLDVPVDYYALVNMGGLEKTVDAVGGVTVNNPFAFKYEGHTILRENSILMAARFQATVE